MPAKNRLKTYIENGYYHVYNRGVEKRVIFQDKQDYLVFLNYLKEYLSPEINLTDLATVSFSLRGRTFQATPKRIKNYYKEIKLLAFCLMPNHFHLLIQQKNKYSMEQFIRSLLTRYSIYFNKKYVRVGTLFQSRYKAVLITSDEYLLHLSRYIHLNPKKFENDLLKTYSSYKAYIENTSPIWLDTKTIMNYFSKPKSLEFKHTITYKSFVEAIIPTNNFLPYDFLFEEE